MATYPKAESNIEVTFTDGAVQTYCIPVASTIAPFLAKQAGETGILTLLAGECAYNIPVSQIREWTIKQISGVRND